MTPEDLLLAPPELTRVMWCDNAGLTRAKAVTRHALGSALRHGVGLSMGQQALPMMYDAVVEGSGLSAVGEVRLVPDLSTLTALPYAEGSSAALGDMRTLGGEPWAHCPRQFARRQVEALSELGYSVLASFENEFYLYGGHGPLDGGVYASLESFEAAHPFTRSLLSALEAQGLTPEMYYPESGPGQHELPIAPAAGLGAADRQLLFKATVRAVARQHGLKASFAAKPERSGAGSGCHLHLSLWRGDANAFHDADGALGLSLVARQAIGGVLAHLPGLCALTVPSVHSYRRLQPGQWSGAYACYGLDNREASVRVTSTHLLPGAGGASTHFELKTCDASANPHLALGGLLAAVLNGLRRDLDPGAPLEVSPGTLSEQERAEAGIVRLPTSLPEALDALAQDEALQEALGPQLARSFTAVRAAEAAYFAGQDEETEWTRHRFAY